jgi:hypothetical protein
VEGFGFSTGSAGRVSAAASGSDSGSCARVEGHHPELGMLAGDGTVHVVCTGRGRPGVPPSRARRESTATHPAQGQVPGFSGDRPPQPPTVGAEGGGATTSVMAIAPPGGPSRAPRAAASTPPDDAGRSRECWRRGRAAARAGTRARPRFTHQAHSTIIARPSPAGTASARRPAGRVYGSPSGAGAPSGRAPGA